MQSLKLEWELINVHTRAMPCTKTFYEDMLTMILLTSLTQSWDKYL